MFKVRARIVRQTRSGPVSRVNAPSSAISAWPCSERESQIRWKCSSPAAAVQEDATKDLAKGKGIFNAGPGTDHPTTHPVPQLSEEYLRTPANRTPELDRILGADNTIKAKALAADIRKLNYELKLIYGRERVSARTIGHPYKVQTTIGAYNRNPRVHVENNKVEVANKVIPNIWLRDNCQCSSCMHDATKQRLLDTFSIPKDISIKNHSLNNEILHIEWSDGHSSSYNCNILGQTVQSYEHRASVRQGLTRFHLWDSSIASNPPRKGYATTKGSHIQQVLRYIRKYGFCYVDNTPFDTPAATEEVLRRISFVRETHYGGFYDFTADLASKDTAYTNIALEAHTDTTYFSDPAGLQAFHLLSHTDGSGGASLLVDGFKVAEELRQSDRHAYKILSTVNVHAHASGNEGISVQSYRGFPVLEHNTATGGLLRVRWNSSDRASIELPIEEVEKWYDAARKFDALLKKKENEYWEQLTPGRVLIFDNWRVLHGRSEFTGKRRICGGYINRDDWISKYKIGELGREEIMRRLPSS